MGLSVRLLLLLGVTVTQLIKHATAVDFVLICDPRFGRTNGHIYRAPMADLYAMQPMPLDGLINPVAVDYDPVRRLVYWVDNGGDDVAAYIGRSNLDGTGQAKLQTGIGQSNGISIDYWENVLYWTETDNQRIMTASANFNALSRELVSLNITKPQDVQVDPAGRKLYWTDLGQATIDKFPTVERLNLDDTTDRRVLVDGAQHPGVMEPYGITLDFEGQRLYFCDPKNNSIYLSDLEGYGLHNLIEIISPEIKPFDLALYQNDVYWTDWAIPALIVAERFQGLYANIAGPFRFFQASGMIIHTDTDRSCYDGYPCMNGGRCRQFIEGYQCVCIPPYTGTNCETMSDNSCRSNPCQNDGECNQFEEGHECLCKTGYSGVTCQTSSFIIVADTAEDKIWKTAVPVKRGAVYEEIMVTTDAPFDLEYDAVADRIYWSDNFTILRARLDGLEQEVVIDDIGNVQGIALDVMDNKLYWTDRERQTIERSQLNGLGRVVLLDNSTGPGVGEPWSIIVDPAGRYMYWTDLKKESHLRTIERARLEPPFERVALIPVNLFQPLALAADFSVSQLFFGDALVNKIETCDLDGRNRRVLIQLRQTDAHPFSIGLYQDIVYWSDNNLNRIAALNRYGSTDGALLVGPDQFTQAAGMVIYEGNDDSCSSSPCMNNGRCRQLPVGYQCVCDATRFIGKNCEIETDDACSSNPCKNSARCVQLLTGFKCVCVYGYSGETCATDDVIFITDQSNGTIYKAPMRTLSFEPIKSNLPSPVAVRYDSFGRHVYWADNTPGQAKVYRTDVNGTTQETIIDNGGLTDPTGLSIDRGNRQIYVTDRGSHKIVRKNIDSLFSTVEDFVTTDINTPQHIVVDWRNEYVYWTNWQDPVRIERMKTDKTGREVVINATRPDSDGLAGDLSDPWMIRPYGLAIDYEEEVLYWGDLNTTRICAYDLTTGDQRVYLDREILKETIINPYDIVVYDEYLYWSDVKIGGLIESNRRFPVALQVGSVEFETPGGLDIYKSLSGCWSEPCKNDGTCSEAGDTYMCTCTDGFTGVHCQTELNECDEGPCQNDGLCQDEVNDYSCFCPAGYAGDNCEIDIDECADTPCKNNGTCLTPEINYYECKCPIGYNCSERCETLCPPACESNPCQNFGTCKEPIPFTWECECPPYTQGSDCSEQNNPCETYPCSNGATCTQAGPSDTNYYYCECLPGWTGRHCEADIQECLSGPCLNGAECYEGTNNYFCLCDWGYTGRLCETNINECASNPCLHGATCRDLVNSYICNCLPYYEGDRCENPKPGKCEEISCENGGTCHDRGGGFALCLCPESYVGDRCERQDFCLNNPCMNDGNCTSLRDGYNCECYKGYYGINCEDNPDECASNPCRNDGSCTEQADSYVCSCTSDWTGDQCETPATVVSCDDVPSPCKNGGTCEGRSGALRINCRCPEGFGGDRCEINIDECLSNPCKNRGRCVDTTNEFYCVCPDPFFGNTCEEVPKNDCQPPTPPKNGYIYPSQKFYNDGERLLFLCETEYVLKGYTETICQDGDWSIDNSGNTPTCIPRKSGQFSNAGLAAGSGIGVAIAVFLLILIILAAIYVARESKTSTPEDRAVVEYTNRQTDGDGFESVQIQPASDENTADTLPIQPKEVD